MLVDTEAVVVVSGVDVGVFRVDPGGLGDGVPDI